MSGWVMGSEKQISGFDSLDIHVYLSAITTVEIQRDHSIHCTSRGQSALRYLPGGLVSLLTGFIYVNILDSAPGALDMWWEEPTLQGCDLRISPGNQLLKLPKPCFQVTG